MTPEEKEVALKAEQKYIDDARRIKEFLADPVVAEVLRRAEQTYYAAIPAADTDEKRRNVWANIKAITGLTSALNGTIDSGKFAQKQQDTRLAAEARASARTPRK